MTIDEELNHVLQLDPQHPCYSHWKQYHLGDLKRGEKISTFLGSRISLQKATVLDVGCGLGGISIAISGFAEKVIGIEANKKFVTFAERRAQAMGKTNVSFVYGSGESLPMPASSVDLVIMNDVVEHFAEPFHAIAETARVLKKGGHVYVLAPNRCSLAVTLRDPHYQLPFVVWFPQLWRDFFVRKLGRGDHYDGNWFPTMSELINAFRTVHVNLTPAGWMDSEGPRGDSANVFSALAWGYPVYIGTRLE